MPGPRPFWYRFTWFLGRPPELTARQWSVLGLVAIVSFFEQYDLYLFTLNLKHIQADLGIAESALGWLGSLVRAGAFLAVPITLAADRVGRRRLLLVTVLAYSVLTGATAFAPNAASFVTLQILARGFTTAETMIAVVVIAEEFAPAHRGWGIGALGAIQSCGAGLAGLGFGFVGSLPYGWRALYLVGVGPLLLVAYWRRKLPETTRFARLREEGAETLRAMPALAPALRMVRMYPGRLLAVGAAAFAMGFAIAPAAFFPPKFLQDVHGWTPGAIATLTLVGGFLGMLGNPAAGVLGDRWGRRPVGILFPLLFSVSAILFYGVTGAWGPVFWVPVIFFLMGSDVTISAFTTELFPTSQRSTASGVRAAMGALGAVAGLGCVSLLYADLGSNWSAVMWLAACGLAVPLIVWLGIPETSGRILEEIAPEEIAAEPSRPPAPPLEPPADQS